VNIVSTSYAFWNQNQLFYHMIRARIDPTLIFESISLFKSEMIEASAPNAASRPSMETSVVFNVLHSHCVYAKPTEHTRLTCVMNASVVPHL
jgi:hypothetical protein